MDVNRNTQIVINDDLLRKIVYCIEKAIGDDLQLYLCACVPHSPARSLRRTRCMGWGLGNPEAPVVAGPQ